MLPTIATSTTEQIPLVLGRIATNLNARAAILRNNPSLWGGAAGVAVYSAVVQTLVPSTTETWPISPELAPKAMLAEALNQIASYPPDLLACHGWTLWAARAVDRLLGGDDDNTAFCRDFDQLLLEQLSQCRTWDGSYDLISGLVAIGGYALDARDDSCGEAILARVLTLLAAWQGDKPYCFSPPGNGNRSSMLQQNPTGYTDLGMAHGNAGVVALLAALIRHNVLKERAQPMLERLMEWFLAHQNPTSQHSRFGYIVEDPNTDARCAWCYGDPGISRALVAAGKACGVTAWQLAGQDLARAITARPAATLGIIDPALCHGSAGLAHILLKHARDPASPPDLAQQCGTLSQQLLADAVRAIMQPNDNPDLSYLEGQCGIGLALASAAYDPAQQLNWDYPLFLE
jgi:hypothetical protein